LSLHVDIAIGDEFDKSRIMDIDSRTFSCIVVGGYNGRIHVQGRQ